MKEFLGGMGLLMALFVPVILLMFGLPALVRWVKPKIFEARKMAFEKSHPGYTLGVLFGVVMPLEIEALKVQALDSPQHYVLIYRNELGFNVPGNNCTLRVNAAELEKSLKAWKAWDPTKNGLGVAVGNKNGVATFKLSVNDVIYPSTNRDLMEVPQEEFINTLGKMASYHDS